MSNPAIISFTPITIEEDNFAMSNKSLIEKRSSNKKLLKVGPSNLKNDNEIDSQGVTLDKTCYSKFTSNSIPSPCSKDISDSKPFQCITERNEATRSELRR